MCHIKVLVIQSCLTLCDPLDYSLPGSAVHRNFQARLLEWVAIPFSTGSSWFRDWTQVSCIADRFFYHLNHQGNSYNDFKSVMWQHSYFLLNYWQVSKESDQMNGNFIQRRKGDRRIYMWKKKHTLPIYALFLKSYSQEICAVQFSSVAQLCPSLCDPMNCSAPGLHVHHQLPQFTQTHIHRVLDTHVCV